MRIQHGLVHCIQLEVLWYRTKLREIDEHIVPWIGGRASDWAFWQDGGRSEIGNSNENSRTKNIVRFSQHLCFTIIQLFLVNLRASDKIRPINQTYCFQNVPRKSSDPLHGPQHAYESRQIWPYDSHRRWKYSHSKGSRWDYCQRSILRYHPRIKWIYLCQREPLQNQPTYWWSIGYSREWSWNSSIWKGIYTYHRNGKPNPCVRRRRNQFARTIQKQLCGNTFQQCSGQRPWATQCDRECEPRETAKEREYASTLWSVVRWFHGGQWTPRERSPRSIDENNSAVTSFGNDCKGNEEKRRMCHLHRTVWGKRENHDITLLSQVWCYNMGFCVDAVSAVMFDWVWNDQTNQIWSKSSNVSSGLIQWWCCALSLSLCSLMQIPRRVRNWVLGGQSCMSNVQSENQSSWLTEWVDIRVNCHWFSYLCFIYGYLACWGGKQYMKWRRALLCIDRSGSFLISTECKAFLSSVDSASKCSTSDLKSTMPVIYNYT